jgi:predicted RNA-binding protein with PUA-like domain
MAKQSWLIKSEPVKYPFAKLVTDGRTTWDGVRNYEARNNLRAMKKGDTCLFYHSNEGKEIVGLAKVSREAYQDPSTDEDWSAVDVEPVRALRKPVTLEAMREHKVLKDMMIFRRGRLSVVPVTKAELDAVLELAK